MSVVVQARDVQPSHQSKQREKIPLLLILQNLAPLDKDMVRTFKTHDIQIKFDDRQCNKLSNLQKRSSQYTAQCPNKQHTLTYILNTYVHTMLTSATLAKSESCKVLENNHGESISNQEPQLSVLPWISISSPTSHSSHNWHLFPRQRNILQEIKHSMFQYALQHASEPVRNFYPSVKFPQSLFEVPLRNHSARSTRISEDRSFSQSPKESYKNNFYSVPSKENN